MPNLPSFAKVMPELPNFVDLCQSYPFLPSYVKVIEFCQIYAN
jgi:hypothetical protein